MPKKWAYIILFSVVVLFILSTWEIYKAFSEEKDVGEYSVYVEPIEKDFHNGLLDGITDLEGNVKVKEEDISP